MFLPASSVRSLIQNENADNSGIKKLGALKSTNVHIRTPFKDRSVNNISPSSKYNSRVMMKRDDKEVSKKVVKNDNCTRIAANEIYKEADDIFSNDYASFKEIPDGFEDIYPSKRLDIFHFLNEYISGRSPKYIYDDKDIDTFEEIPVVEMEINYPDLSSTFGAIDVPLPTFNI